MKSIIRYFREVRAEFHSITWPKKDALIQLTVVVISVSVVVSVILGGLDLLFTTSFGLLTKDKTPIQEVLPEAVSSPTTSTAPIITLSPAKISPTIKK